MDQPITSLKELEQLFLQDKDREPRTLSLVAAHDDSALSAVLNAYKKGFIIPILIGDKEKILALPCMSNFDVESLEIIDEKDNGKAIGIGVQLVHEGRAQVLMKGAVKTSDIMKHVLNRETGLRHRKMLSHFALFEVENYHKLIAITDVALNIAPSLHEKVNIIGNSVEYFHRLGISKPKVAVLGAIEVVNEKMEATLDAALLSKMNQRDQIPGCLIDGPLAFDNAISQESAIKKQIKSEVAGDCDLLLVPDIEVGNVLYKSLIFFANASVASIIIGAKVPIVLTSRSDSEESKLNSILLSCF